MHSNSGLQWQEYGGKGALHENGDDDEELDEFVPGLGQRAIPPWYVIPERYIFRQVWNLVLVFLLVYTGTIFPYRLVFVELNLQGSSGKSTFWDAFDLVIDIIFYIDLVVWFFFSYRCRQSGREVYEIDRIVCRYLKTYFVVNFIACIPPQAFGAIISVFEGGGSTDDSSAGFNKAGRLSRLQRISRLARLARIIRLAKLFDCGTNAVWNWIQSFRYVRIVNFVCGLFWVVHLVACGWYLTAWFHEDHSVTWVASRGILDAGPFDQWIHANYFVLTVFTTVGFGDMSASTLGEIFYVSFTMIIGAIVHSIIMSEVINILMSVDQSQSDMKAQKDLVQSFTDHVRLNRNLSQDLMLFFEYNKSRRHQIDREKLKNLLTSSVLPRELMESLAGGLFEGELERNKFLTTCLRYEKKLPVRFPLLLALALNERNFARKEMVYCAYDLPWNVFLVVKGTFAYIAFPSNQGGLADLPSEVVQNLLKKKNSMASDEGSSTGMADRMNKWTISATKTTATIKSKTKVSRSPTEATNMHTQKHGVLFPYELFGPRTYFGDLELMIPNARTRYSGVRCESEGGQVLVLHKNDLTKLMHDFSRFGYAWRCAAKRRDEHRRRLMSRLTVGRKVDVLAAVTIQRFFKFKHGLDNGLHRPRSKDELLPRTDQECLSTTPSERPVRRFSVESSASEADASGKTEKMFQSLRREMHSALELIRQELRCVITAKHQDAHSERISNMTSVSILNIGPMDDVDLSVPLTGNDRADSSNGVGRANVAKRKATVEKEVMLL